MKFHLFIASTLSICWASFLVESAAAQGPQELVPIESVTHVAIQNGNWSNPDTWADGAMPTDGARVHVPPAVHVVVDTAVQERLKTLRLDGTLSFTRTANSLLKVETLIGTANSHLEMGTPTMPIPSEFTAEFLFIDEGPMNLSEDFGQFGKGWVHMGSAVAHGAAKTAWLDLDVPPAEGDTTLWLSSAPVGWGAGDRIVITGTSAEDPTSEEVRVVTEVIDNQVTIDSPLNWGHLPPREDLRVHAGNLSRNVLWHSENPTIDRRGHVMFMNSTEVDLAYVRHHQLGRTNKQVQVDDWFFPTLVADEYVAGERTNIRGRYSCHFHRGGVNPATTPQATVRGCVVEDDPGWAFVNHSSHVDFIDNLSYNVVGGAFQTESGDEIGTFHHNLAVRTVNPDFPILDPETAPVDAREDSQDFAFQGDAFWFHGGGVSVTDNVASGFSGHGFIFWTEGQREVGTTFDLQNMFSVGNIPHGELLGDLTHVQSWWVPVLAFAKNTAYSGSKGFAAYYVHATLFEDITELSPAYLETVHTTFEDLTLWNFLLIGVEMQNCERFTFRNLDVVGPGDEESIGVMNAITVARESHWENCQIQDCAIGMVPPMQGAVEICGGTFANRWDFLIVPPQRDSRAPGWDRDLRIEQAAFGEAPYPSPDRVQFYLAGEAALAGEVPFVEPEFQSLFFLIPDRIFVDTENLPGRWLFHNTQSEDFVPIHPTNAGDAAGSYLSDVLTKANSQLLEDLGLATGGAIMPSDAISDPSVFGGLVSPTAPPMSLPVCHFLRDPLLPANNYDDFGFEACWSDAPTKVAGVASPMTESCAGCLADLNGDGAINISDLLILLGDFGCNDSACSGDATGDGMTNVEDVLALLGAFGEACNPVEVN